MAKKKIKSVPPPKRPELTSTNIADNDSKGWDPVKAKKAKADNLKKIKSKSK